MDRLGFIHEKLDIKILILYVLSRLSYPVDRARLDELCQNCDNAIVYFDYTDCLSELEDAKHIEEDEDGLYRITEKGKYNVSIVESSLPYTVRTKAQKLIAPLQEELAREALIKTTHEHTDTGCVVHLSMSDGISEVIKLDLLCSGDEHARLIKRNFRRSAEDYYNDIIELLSKEDSK